MSVPLFSQLACRLRPQRSSSDLSGEDTDSLELAAVEEEEKTLDAEVEGLKEAFAVAGVLVFVGGVVVAAAGQ